ncbi:MAG: aminotransferase class I/II-fold pyridoxal phosphate-dependent enzyme [Cytophagia bacterium]|nr:aminotransferase class I/II-fold pyridoxal phosphate-dependent enzyme [Cytophagia bacterium]
MSESKKQNIETLLAHDEQRNPNGAVVPPIYQNSLFTFESWDDIDQAFDNRMESFIYTRGRNPTVKQVEEKLAALCGGEKAQLFPSGMGAISAAIMHCVNAGDHIITIKNLYGPANNFISSYLKPKFNVEVTYVTGKDISDFENAIQDNTSLIYLESPSSAVFSLQDIEAVAKLAKSKGIKTMIDNTWTSPIFQKPLAMGIDLEIHSCSKYIGGHSDVVAGLVVGSKQEVESISLREFEWIGAKIAPFEAWLLLRSLRTLPIRMRQHQENALAVAEFLENHPKIQLLRYPGAKSFDQKELAKKQMTGLTGLMGFQLKTDDLEKIKAFVNTLKYFHLGVSWGGHESLIYAPAISYLKELSPDQFAGLGISLGDMRISVGLENKEDLIADLERALELI